MLAPPPPAGDSASAEAALAHAAGTRLPSDPAARAARLLPLLAAVTERLAAKAANWVMLSCATKGIDPASDLAAEELASGPLAVARALQIWRRSLGHVARGQLPRLPGPPRPLRGALAFAAMPALPFDRLSFAGYRGRVIVSAEHPVQVLPPPRAGVAVVLGAGNVTSVPLADLLTLLCRDGQPVIVKLHPLHAPLREVFADVFAPLRDVGCEFVLGATDLGQALAADPRVTQVHLTGAPTTFAQLVAANARRPTPAHLGAELGNVTPVLLAPGRFSSRELTARIDDVAAMFVNNGSFNCAAARVLVTARGWPQRAEFLARLGARLASIPPRRAFHPGAATRFARLLGRSAADPKHLPWTLVTDADPEAHPLAFAQESFAPLLFETALDARDVPTFLSQAVRLCNERLGGELAAMVLADRRTLRAHRQAFAAACDALRYGTVAINTWAALAFAWMSTPWGAAPGNTLAAPGSGVGFVHDPFFLRAPQKTILEGPVRPWPTPPWWPGHRAPRAVLERLLALTLAPSTARALRMVRAAVRA